MRLVVARMSIVALLGLLVAATASCSWSSTALPGAVATETTTTAAKARTATDQTATANIGSTAVGATSTAPQVGLNFTRFFWTGEGRPADSAGSAGSVQARTEPDAIFRDFPSLGVQVYRQSVKADLLWDVVELRPGEWHFDQADAVLARLPR